jgi:hypothetical protein
MDVVLYSKIIVMAIPSQQLLIATGATSQFTLLSAGASVPPILNITTSAAAVVGATSIPVVITNPGGGAVLATSTIANGTYLLAGTGVTAQIVIISTDVFANVTALPVEPLRRALPTGTVIQAYANCLPMIGLENANGGVSKSNNSVVLLSQAGWGNNDYSTGSWEISGTLYTPINQLYATSVFAIGKALVDETYLYIERFLANGEYLAGQAIVTDFSDTVQSAGYITRAVKFMGTGRPVIKSLATL